MKFWLMIGFVVSVNMENNENIGNGEWKTRGTKITNAYIVPDLKCDFEDVCQAWRWERESFWHMNAANGSNQIDNKQLGPSLPGKDADGNDNGHYLMILDESGRKWELNLTSSEINPRYFDNGRHKICALTFYMNSDSLPNNSMLGNISILIREGNRTKVIATYVKNDAPGVWQKKRIFLGFPEEIFRIVVEIGVNNFYPSYIAIDNINLEDCFPDAVEGECPLYENYKCTVDDTCLPVDTVCDIERDCSDGQDEMQQCDLVPPGTRCTFENGLCGWRNASEKYHTLRWRLKSGPSTSLHSGPSFDNTFKNATGTYAYVDMSTGVLGSIALMESVPINPPPVHLHGNIHSPFYNSCYITFFYHKYGPHSGSLGLYLREDKLDLDMEIEGGNNIYRLWWSYGNKGDMWLRQMVILPNITKRYTIQFEARKSMSSRGDIAIDDVAFSPKCFGIGIPREFLKDYDYSEYPKKSDNGVMDKAFNDQPVYLFTSCGAMGPEGPTKEKCALAYKNSTVKAAVLEAVNQKGMQKWIVPETGYYSIIAKGARGGKGADGLGESKAATIVAVTELDRNEAIYILVGQEGQDACRKLNFDRPSSCIIDLHLRTNTNVNYPNSGKKILDGGGGGGGATYVFTWVEGNDPKPLVVAAGGGGLAHGPAVDDGRQHGNGTNSTLPSVTAPSFGSYPAGSGGGWMPGNYSTSSLSGEALLRGGRGGPPCYQKSDRMQGSGGFGGGGGGCVSGGGGGGFTAWTGSKINGEGGWSMVSDEVEYKIVKRASNYGTGMVMIIPAVTGCECDYRCVALDEFRINTKCVCPIGWTLGQDHKSCILINIQKGFDAAPMWIIMACFLFLSVFLIIISLLLYNRYLQQKTELTRHKVYGNSVQLANLSAPPRSVRLTELNPNYEFGGVTYTIRDLKEIPREKIQLVKPLGCGAFGDVYQGLLRKRDTDSVDLAVAVKILPALSSDQTEADFLMEALIMSKFNHPNIVHFIGACFDSHPRYIILELLSGGDLKNFLRDNRPKIDKPSPLTMKDLLQCAVDIAKGCQYLEQLHFVHRDIAARNCLLTSRGPGRVVKIADFGMSRDIYRSDYYKKGGKAMLPIKWMPPEAFLDGLFSSKTDVWSFGVVLWEIMSLGFMPYTGIRNRDVMQFVTRGARLSAPSNCPPPIYAIMVLCWGHEPDQRPTFTMLVEKLGYCMQDPEVMKAQLPAYSGPLPSDLNHSMMMSGKNGEEYAHTDYMIPIIPDTPTEWGEEEETDDASPRYVAVESAPSPDKMNATPESGGPFILSGNYVEDVKI